VQIHWNDYKKKFFKILINPSKVERGEERNKKPYGKNKTQLPRR